MITDYFTEQEIKNIERFEPNFRLGSDLWTDKSLPDHVKENIANNIKRRLKDAMGIKSTVKRWMRDKLTKIKSLYDKKTT